MKSSPLVLIAACYVLAGVHPLQSQWTQVHGPYGSDDASLSVSDTAAILASTARGGYYLSKTKGDTWIHLKPTSPYSDGRQLLSSGGYLFTWTSDGIFRSSDNGRTWITINAGLTDTEVWTVAGNGPILFAGTWHGGIFRSTDYGANWSAVNSGIGSLAMDVRRFWICDETIFASTSNGIHVSTNNGIDWTRLAYPDSIPLAYSDARAFAVIDTTIFAGTIYGIVRTNDKGKIWTSVNSGLGDTYVLSLAVFGTDLFAGTSRGVYRSSDKGASWISLLPSRTWITSLVVSGQYLLAGTNGGGVLRSADRGTTWQLSNDGLANTTVTAIGVSPAGIFAGTSLGLYRLTDDGEGWDKLKTDSIGGINDFAFSGTTMLAGTDGHGVYRSVDNGSSWTSVNAGLEGVSITAFAVNQGAIFAGSMMTSYRDGGIFRSTDNGSSWTSVNGGMTSHFISSLATMGSVVFAGATTGMVELPPSAGGVFVSTDNGASWAEAGLKNKSIVTLAFSGTALFAGTQEGVYRSIDSGAAWTLVNNGLTYTNITRLLNVGRTIFAGTDHGLYVTSDDGGTWRDAGLGLPDNVILALAASSTDIYAGTWGYGVWRRQLSEITDVSDNSRQMPVRFALDQNFPNPFNPSTMFAFTLPSRSHVSLKVFDVMGREVAVIISETLPAGTYARAWNALGCPSGVYFYRLQAGTQVATKRLVILK